jgi:hypothetical protein
MALNQKFMISPNLQEFFINPADGLPLSNGTVTYKIDSARSDLKSVFELTGNFGSYDFTALPNPLHLSGVGTPINGAGQEIRVYYYPYDENGSVENYYIEVADEDGNPVLQRQAWPNVFDGSTGNANYVYNFARNSTFYGWSNGTDFPAIGTGSAVLSDFVFDDWAYQQDDPTQIIEVSRGTFLPGDASVDGNPPFYLIYNNTNKGSEVGNYNRFSQTYISAQTLNGQDVAASVWINQPADGNPTGSFSLTLRQFFGTGGSPSLTTSTNIILTSALVRGTWTQYTGSAPLPSTVGKTFGTNGDDVLIADLNMPLNETSQVFIAQLRIQEGILAQTSVQISSDDIQKETNYTGLYPAWTTGDVKFTLKSVATTGWLMMNDQTIGNLLSGATNVGISLYALYVMIWNNFNLTTFTPIYTSAGVLTTFGGTAAADWAANKRLSLTKALGRVLSGANPTPTPIVSKVFTASSSGGLLITVNDGTSFYRGTVVQVSNTGGALPTGLSAVTNYYVAPVPSTAESASTFLLCPTLADAINYTNGIAFTDAGSGTNTIFTINAAHAFGSYLGEDSHALFQLQTPAHTHALTGSVTATTPNPYFYSVLGGTPLTSGGGANEFKTENTITVNNTLAVGASTPSDTAHNNIQPTTYLNVMIKI